MGKSKPPRDFTRAYVQHTCIYVCRNVYQSGIVINIYFYFQTIIMVLVWWFLIWSPRFFLLPSGGEPPPSDYSSKSGVFPSQFRIKNLVAGLGFWVRRYTHAHTNKLYGRSEMHTGNAIRIKRKAHGFDIYVAAVLLKGLRRVNDDDSTTKEEEKLLLTGTNAGWPAELKWSAWGKGELSPLRQRTTHSPPLVKRTRGKRRLRTLVIDIKSKTRSVLYCC